MHRGAAWQLKRKRLYTLVRHPARRVLVVPAVDLQPAEIQLLCEVKALAQMDVIVRGRRLSSINASERTVYNYLRSLVDKGVLTWTKDGGYKPVAHVQLAA